MKSGRLDLKMHYLEDKESSLLVAAQTIPTIDFIIRELVDNSIDANPSVISK